MRNKTSKRFLNSFNAKNVKNVIFTYYQTCHKRKKHIFFFFSKKLFRKCRKRHPKFGSSIHFLFKVLGKQSFSQLFISTAFWQDSFFAPPGGAVDREVNSTWDCFFNVSWVPPSLSISDHRRYWIKGGSVTIWKTKTIHGSEWWHCGHHGGIFFGTEWVNPLIPGTHLCF